MNRREFLQGIAASLIALVTGGKKEDVLAKSVGRRSSLIDVLSDLMPTLEIEPYPAPEFAIVMHPDVYRYCVEYGIFEDPWMRGENLVDGPTMYVCGDTGPEYIAPTGDPRVWTTLDEDECRECRDSLWAEATLETAIDDPLLVVKVETTQGIDEFAIVSSQKIDICEDDDVSIWAANGDCLWRVMSMGGLHWHSNQEWIVKASDGRNRHCFVTFCPIALYIEVIDPDRNWGQEAYPDLVLPIEL